MTEITVFLKDGKPIGFDAHGHTGYAECGEDIVCAAVSAITQTAAMGVSELVRCPAALEIKDGGLYLMLEKTVKGSKLLPKSVSSSETSKSSPLPVNSSIFMAG